MNQKLNVVNERDSYDEINSQIQHPLVVVIDDDEDHRILASYTLDSIHCATLLVEDGTNVIDLAITHQPDLILMDIRLPGTNGFELLQKLKTNTLTCEIPVIAVTAFTHLEYFDTTLLNQFAGVLKKPYALEDLETLVIQQLKPVKAKIFSTLLN